MAAADLTQAANDAASNLAVLWAADTLKAKVTTFWQAIDPVFPESSPGNKPIGDWIAIIAALAPTILAYEQSDRQGVGSVTTYNLAVDYVYRLCKFAAVYDGITGAQQTQLLAAYNAAFT